MNTKNNQGTIGPFTALIIYLVFCGILFYVLSFSLSEDINVETEDSITVVATIEDAYLRSSSSFNGKTFLTYYLTYEYDFNGKTKTYNITQRVLSTDSYDVTIDLYLNKDTGELTLISVTPDNFEIIYFSIVGGVFIFFIILNLFFSSAHKKRKINDEYSNNNKGINNNLNQTDEYTNYRSKLQDLNDLEKVVYQDNVVTIENETYIRNKKEENKDDPFSNDDCKYNIDKDDPFEDFYKKGK